MDNSAPVGTVQLAHLAHHATGALQMFAARTRNRRAFSVLEVVLTLTIVAVLSATAVVSYSKATQRGRLQAAQAQIGDVAEQTLSRRALDGGGVLSRAQVARVLSDVLDATVTDATTDTPTGQGWTMLAGESVPDGPTQMSVAFPGGAISGPRLALAAVTSDGHAVAAVVDVSNTTLTLAGAVTTCTGPAAASAAAVLTASTSDAVCPAP